MSDTVYQTTATVHSVTEEDVLVNAVLPNGAPSQVKAPGVTVELIDHNGSCHTHRFLNVEKAKAIFTTGAKIDCTYTQSADQSDAAPPPPPPPPSEDGEA